MEDELRSVNWVLVTIVAIVIVIVLGGIFELINLRVQHDIVNPQVRQNLVDDPQTTIANKADFHNKLGEIIQADQNVITDINLLSKCSSNDSNYDTAVNNLTGVEQIRSQAIAAYNAEADNPDKGKDLDTWMPKRIATVSLPSDNAQAVAMLNNEISQLQTSYNHQ